MYVRFPQISSLLKAFAARERPQSRVSLSPRFLSLLTEGQGAQQLLGADFQWFFSPLIHFCVKLHGLFSELPGMHGHPLISHHCTEWDNRLFIHWRISWNFYSWDDQGLHNNVGYYPLNSKQYSNIFQYIPMFYLSIVEEIRHSSHFSRVKFPLKFTSYIYTHTPLSLIYRHIYAVYVYNCIYVYTDTPLLLVEAMNSTGSQRRRDWWGSPSSCLWWDPASRLCELGEEALDVAGTD